MNLKRKQPLQTRSINTVESILEASRSILQNEGPLKFSTNSIAKRSGVSVGSIYQYFQSKEKIIETLLEIDLKKSMNKFDEGLQSLLNQSYENKVSGLINHLSRLMSENEYLLQAQKLFDRTDSFNIDRFFDIEIMDRAKSFFSNETDESKSTDIEKVLVVAKQIFLPNSLDRNPQAVRVLNSLAFGTIQSNI